VWITRGAHAHAAAATHGALLHHVRQFVGDEAAIRGAGVAAQKDVVAGGERVRRQTAREHIRLGVMVDAHVAEAGAEAGFH
jgi:hypothetical protein